jgi:hypothetical protein
VAVGVVNWLRQNGHNAKHLRDEGLHRIPNGEIVALSKREKVSIIPIQVAVSHGPGNTAERTVQRAWRQFFSNNCLV